MRPDPQYGVQLSVADIPLELPIYPIYGVTSSNQYIPIQVDDDGALVFTGSISVASVSVNNFPATQAVTQSGIWTVALSSGSIDIGTVDQGTPASLANAWPTKVTNGTYVLAVNSDGSINADISSSGSIPVTIDHSLDSVAIYGTDGSTDRFIKTDASGNLQVGFAKASSSSVTSKARSNVSQTFLALNASRKGVTIYNDSSALLYVKFGAVASSSDFTVRLSAQSYYEVPFNYTGQIDGIWATNGAGNALITELS